MFELTPFVHGNQLHTYDPFRAMEDLENGVLAIMALEEIKVMKKLEVL